MALLATIESSQSIEQRYYIECLSKDEMAFAMRQFEAMRANNSLIGNFDEDVWSINNESISTNVHFKFNQLAIAHQENTTYDEFVKLVKCYICLCFGKYTAVMYQRITNAISNAVNETNCFTVLPKNVSCLQKIGVADFIGLLPWADDQFIYPLEIKGYDAVRRRSLSEYQSYFLFNDIMNHFWASATDQEKDCFYPLYLWWSISMIIPIRVTEFTVIPKSCLTNKDGKWYITIRRTAMKGNKGISHRYKLDSDYKKYTYEITYKAALDIQDFQERAKKYEPAKIDSLFSDDMFCKTASSVMKAKVQYFYPHMRVSHFYVLLDCFFKYVVRGKFGFNILPLDEVNALDKDGEQHELPQKSIINLNLGDTRHIALQNLLLNGCNLLMAREISGHDTIDMIFHYSGNMENLIKCRAYNLFKLSQDKKHAANTVASLQNGTEEKNLSALIVSRTNTSGIAVDNGTCYSPKFTSNYDATDCYAVGGNCSICCYHKGISDMELLKKQRERDFKNKIARVKIWMNSAKKLKSSEQIMIISENMSTAAENLEAIYLKILEGGGTI